MFILIKKNGDYITLTQWIDTFPQMFINDWDKVIEEENRLKDNHRDIAIRTIKAKNKLKPTFSTITI